MLTERLAKRVCEQPAPAKSVAVVQTEPVKMCASVLSTLKTCASVCVCVCVSCQPSKPAPVPCQQAMTSAVGLRLRRCEPYALGAAALRPSGALEAVVADASSRVAHAGQVCGGEDDRDDKHDKVWGKPGGWQGGPCLIKH